MIPTYTTSIGLPKICLAFDWPTQMKIPRTSPVNMTYQANYLTEGLQKCTILMDIPLTIVVVSITMPMGIMTFYLPIKDCSQVL